MLYCITAASAASRANAHSAAGDTKARRNGWEVMAGGLDGRCAGLAGPPPRDQFMMFSANHLRHSAVFSARSLWSMMMACLLHCSGVVNTPGSLAMAGSTFASVTIGLPFLNLATSACTCGSIATLMNL